MRRLRGFSRKRKIKNDSRDFGRVQLTRRIAILICALSGVTANGIAADSPDARELFEMRIRPLLAKRCYACHASAKMGGLEMDSREALLKGGGRGPSIFADKPEESLLLQAVSYKLDGLKMPPAGKLPENEIQDLTAWVKAGAYWPASEKPAIPKGPAYTITAAQRAFWAFQPVRKPALPAVRDSRWSKNPIDQLLEARREAAKLEAAKPADKLTLLRRASYDLIGLPPTPEEVDAFMRDSSPAAFAKVVDRLLASPRYGERWGRYWLDVARYSDDKLADEIDDPYPNAFRYRDWVIQAFNDDMPYDRFIKAQIAGDQLGEDARYEPGLGFFGLRPKYDSQEDRVDAVTRGFLGLTAACARCHNHKFDPIPTKDYYALLGVFTSTEESEYHLAPEAQVKAYKEAEKKVKDQEARIRDFLYAQASQFAEILTDETPRYLTAARKVLGPSKMDTTQAAKEFHLDRETLERWVRYLQITPKDHPYLDRWQDESFDLQQFRARVLDVLKERKQVDEQNAVIKAQAAAQKKGGGKVKADVVSLKTLSYYLWRDLFFSDFYGNQFKQEDDGVLYSGPNRGYLTSDGTVERGSSMGHVKEHLDSMREELAELKHVAADPVPVRARDQGFGQAEDGTSPHRRIGGESGRRSSASFSLDSGADGQPQAFQKRSGRLELASAIADPRNPLTARVMVNRIWQHHFGAGIVRTPSDFGRMGDTPGDPELRRCRLSGFSLRRERMVDEDVASRDHAVVDLCARLRRRGKEHGDRSREPAPVARECSAAGRRGLAGFLALCFGRTRFESRRPPAKVERHE